MALANFKQVQPALIRGWLEDQISNETDNSGLLKTALERDGYTSAATKLYVNAYNFAACFFAGLSTYVEYSRETTGLDGCFVKVNIDETCWHYMLHILRNDPDTDGALQELTFGFIYVLSETPLTPLVQQTEFLLPVVVAKEPEGLLTLNSTCCLTELFNGLVTNSYQTVEAVTDLKEADNLSYFKASRKADKGEYWSYATLLMGLGPETKWAFSPRQLKEIVSV